MADFDSAVASIQKWSAQHQKVTEWRIAYLGDGNGNVYTSQANYYLVRYPLSSSPAVEMYGGGALFAAVDGVRVIIGYTIYQPNVYQIIGTADSRLDAAGPVDGPVTSPGGGGVGYSNVPAHAINHMYLAADPVYINLRQFTPLGVFPAGGLIVKVWPGYIPRSGTDISVAEQNIDLTASVPGSGARYSLISFDATGAVVVTDGSINAGGFAALTVADIPDTPAGNWRSAAVALYVGQTEIVETQSEIDILDLRFPEEKAAGIGGHVIRDEGSALTQRLNLDFVGAGVTATDDSATDTTIVTITGGVIGVDTGNVSNPPTQAELIAAIGSPAVANPLPYLVNDAGLGTHEYLCVSDNYNWHYLPLVKAQSVAPTVTVTSTVTLVSAGTNWAGRASIKRRSDNVLVMCYYQATAHAANDGALHIKFSDDDGATWTAADTKLGGGAVTGFPMNPTGAGAGEDAGEPWLYLADNGDLILHMWRVDYGVTANGTYQSTSTDGGETWSASAQVNFGGIADDAKVFATDDDFVYGGVIYAGARVYDDAVPTNCKNIFIKSTNNGATWTYVADISSFTTDTIEVGLEYLGSNTIIAILRDLNNTVTYKATSTDMGATWSALSDVTSVLQASGRYRIFTRSHLKGLANWWNDPVLLMCGFQLMTPGSSQPRRNCIWISQDSGATWSGPFYTAAQVDDAGYGDLFYDATNDRYVFISYQGTLAAADLVQYNLTITGI